MKYKRTSRTLRNSIALGIAFLGVCLLLLSPNRSFALQVFQKQSDSTTEETPSYFLPRWLLSESSLCHGLPPLAPAAEASEQEETAPSSPDDAAETHPETFAEVEQGQVVEKYFPALEGSGEGAEKSLQISNKTGKALDMEAIAQIVPAIPLGANTEPQILIIHTHGTEAFAQDGADVYEESGVARTIDPQHNIIRVGEEIGRVFTEMGLSVLHDQRLYDYPSYNGSYDRSKVSVQSYLAQYPSIQLVLDIHRDAIIGEDGTVYKAVTEIDGNKTAQVMLVMGSDDGGAAHPNWQQNLALALDIQESMNTLWPTLARPLTLRSSRFNQQLSHGSILVEVGSHGNTMEEALAGARLFARCAGEIFLSLRARA